MTFCGSSLLLSLLLPQAAKMAESAASAVISTKIRKRLKG